MTNLDTASDAFLSQCYSLIRDVPDFPKKGIIFKDIAPLLASENYPLLIQNMADRVRDAEPLAIAGIESRGFILGSAMAHEMNCGFVPVRKKGKLPPPVVSHSYKLEYGEDTIEVQPGRGQVVLIDDVLATGGTLTAAASALTKAGFEVVDILVLINLKFLNSFEFNGIKAKSIFTLHN